MLFKVRFKRGEDMGNLRIGESEATYNLSMFSKEHATKFQGRWAAQCY
jgi:hypothetical protein